MGGKFFLDSRQKKKSPLSAFCLVPIAADAHVYGRQKVNYSARDIMAESDEVKARSRVQRIALEEKLRAPVSVELKRAKLDRIAPLLKPEYAACRTATYWDCLTTEMRLQTGIVDTEAVSENPYHVPAQQMFDRNAGGLILDVGSGRRSTYSADIVNFEIVAYDTTDVLGVGESLPFLDGVFDAVHSNAVLEHVRDPVQCAKEMQRVLKPGGDLMCCVPFLTPLHAYPHHYFNMTHVGLRSIFTDVRVRAVEVYEELRPLSALQWSLGAYAAGLRDPHTRANFLEMRVSDLIALPPGTWATLPIVYELDAVSNKELATCNTLFATKPRAPAAKEASKETEATCVGVGVGAECAPLVIHKAWYGTDDTKCCDVAATLRTLVRDNEVTISVDQKIMPLLVERDPCPGTPKRLRVEYSRGDVHTVSTFEEYVGSFRTPVLL